ncbi:MAG: hypothetical protein ACOY5B_00315 [Spirochaetota bacterium]
MKPLDLNVSIQNTYEAARVEAVRLEKEHVLNRLSGEDSMREQRLRDSQVNQPEAKIMHEDMFSAEAYEAPDYTEQGSPEKKKQRDSHPAAQDEKTAAGDEPATERKEPADGESHSSGFSTYA